MDKEDKMIINANPTKEFFISMLTRDIDIQPAIAELIDNSLDGARRFRRITGIQCSIEILFSEDKFSIVDKCGGISVEEARDYCFRFGRPSEKDENPDLNKGKANIIGVFGIGMKRALFRLGKKFLIKSITKTESFTVEVDVDTWLGKKDIDWTFEFTSMNTGEDNNFSICGTEIVVTELYQTISSTFQNPYFIQNFMEYIKRRSSTLKELNVLMTVNNENIEYIDEKIIYDDEFKPFIRNILIDKVHIKVIAACAHMGEPKKSGWYVFCNGRMVLYADQSEITGWGTNSVPTHHTSHATFRGYVLFESEDLDKLPWNTMKTGVDTSSKYYKVALITMVDATKQFITFRNGLDDVILSNETLQLEDIFRRTEVSIFAPIITNMTKDQGYVFPEHFPSPKKPMTGVSFKVEKERADLVKLILDVKTNGKMGEKLFDYFYEREIDEDE